MNEETKQTLVELRDLCDYGNEVFQAWICIIDECLARGESERDVEGKLTTAYLRVRRNCLPRVRALLIKLGCSVDDLDIGVNSDD